MRIRGQQFNARCVVLLIMTDLCLVGAIGQTTQTTQTTWVRGKIQRQGKFNYPLSRVKVTLVPAAYKNDAKRALRTYTRDDGMYDFRVPAGSYVLTVWVSERDSKTYSIVVRPGTYFDIAPIRI